MSGKNQLIATASIAALLCAGGYSFALANEEPAFAVEEIIVSARRRDESIQRVPVAVSAFSGIELAEQSLTNTMEIGELIPNVMTAFASGGGGAGSGSNIYIRGIGQQDFQNTVDPGVGMYIDGVYHARIIGGVKDLLDVSRLEVLKGPQGTLFGKNTVGGVINIVSVLPQDDTSGKFEITAGRFNRLDGRASANFPLIDNELFARVSVSSKFSDGPGRRIDFETGETLARLGDENSISGRAQLRWVASEDIEINLSADVTRERENAIPMSVITVNEASPIVGLWNATIGAATPYGNSAVTGHPYDIYGNGPNDNNLDAWGVSGTVDWKIGDNLNLKSITAYRDVKTIFNVDTDATYFDYANTAHDTKHWQFSQEFQLSGAAVDDRLDWLVGFFYLREDVDDGIFTYALPGIEAILSREVSIEWNVTQKTDAYAGFAHGSFNITDELSVSAGIRYSWEKKDFTTVGITPVLNFPVVPFTADQESWGEWTPKGSIEYQWTPDVMTYVSVSRGFKSGGFNGRPGDVSGVVPFNPETLMAYEAGLKSQWLDRRLRLNVAGYYYDYKDIQLNTVTAAPGGGVLTIVQNAGEATVKGFEAELTARPVEGLTLTGGIGYTDFEFDSLAPDVVGITLDTVPARTPKWSGNLGIRYETPVSDAANLILRGDMSYKGSHFQDNINSPQLEQDSFALLNARVTYEHESGWAFSVFGTNLTDKRYMQSGQSAFTSIGFVVATFGMPREWGVSLSKEF